MAQKNAQFSVYVIELKPNVLDVLAFKQRNPNHNPAKPCVYVGQTAKTPELRFDQHLNGHKCNRYVRDFGVRLRPKLYEKYNPLATRQAAQDIEKALAERLQRRGYAVWWN